MGRPIVTSMILGLVAAVVVLAALGNFSWLTVGLAALAGVLGLIRLALSRWTPTRGTSPEARQAEARLSATRNISAR